MKDEITLQTVSKQFQYGNLCRQIDRIDDIKLLRSMIKEHILIAMKRDELDRDLRTQSQQL